MKEGKPFFFRIDLTELYDFATEPEGINMSLLQFAKELKKGQSEFPAIQKIINEAHAFIAKKAASGKTGMEKRWQKKRKKDNTVITPLKKKSDIFQDDNSTVITNDNTPITSSSSSSSSSNNNNSSTETETETEIIKSKDNGSKKRFLPPTIQEITDYCNERQNNVNPSKFFNHYQSNGWMVGKNKMKDWKAAICTWEGNSQSPLFADKPKSFRERVNDAAVEGFLAERGIYD